MTLSDIKVSIKNRNVLDGINIILNSNDKIGLVGVNGSGKSTLLKIMAGEIKPDSGNIKFFDEKIGYLKQEIAHTFDNYSILHILKKKLE